MKLLVCSRSALLRIVVVGALAVGLVSLPAHAQRRSQPLLHEYIPPDPAEDIDIATTPPEDSFPSAIDTRSGRVDAPDQRANPEPKRIYQPESQTPSEFRPDRDTRRPNMEHYDDPFSPSLTPFKRLNAWNAVNDDYSLYVRDFAPGKSGRHRPVPIGGATGNRAVYDTEDRFFGDMTVSAQADQYVRIPTVGPDARLLKLVAIPDVEVRVWRDTADNWFVKTDFTGRLRLIMQLAIRREVFGSSYGDVAWSGLPRVSRQPWKHRRSYQKVASAIGLSRTMSPRAVVEKMVAYFRSFQPSTEQPREHDDIYLDLALSRKGVCRHRAFAFMVTALNIGIPARLVANEAHAWVEVHDGSLWHRVDLGGAAADLADQPHLDRPPHVPPPDPYSWPKGRDSGQDLAHRHREDAVRARLDPDSAVGLNAPLPPAAPGQDGGVAQPKPSEPFGGNGPDQPPPAYRPPAASVLSIESLDRDIFRGYPLHLKGQAKSEEQQCGHLRIDVYVMLEGTKAEKHIGTLSTDEDGIFDGAIVIPRDLPVGDHELLLSTGGNMICGPGQGR